MGAPAADAHFDHGASEGACQAGNVDGTDNRDEISDGAGDEVMNSTRGGENLYGDSAADNLHGSPNAGFQQGGRGPDRMFGGTNKDYIDGVDGIAGNDKIYGGWGTDHCVGDEGDTFEGCDGNVVEVPVPSDASAQTEGAADICFLASRGFLLCRAPDLRALPSAHHPPLLPARGSE